MCWEGKHDLYVCLSQDRGIIVMPTLEAKNSSSVVFPYIYEIYFIVLL